MIELRLISGAYAGEALDLAPNTSLSLEINNPLLSRDVIPGSYSLPFTLPATPRNRLRLGFPERLDLSARPGTRYQVVLYIEGMYWRSGDLILRKVSNTSYSANFQTGVSVLKEKLAINLKSLPHEVIDIDKQSSLITSHVFQDVLTGGFEADPAHIAETEALSQGKPYAWYRMEGDLGIDNFFTINGTTYEQAEIGWQKRVRNEILASDSDVKMQYYRTLTGGIYYHNYFFWVASGSWNTPMDISFDENSPFVLLESGVQIYADLAIDDFNNHFADNALPGSDFVMPTFWNPALLGEDRNSRALHNVWDPATGEYKLYHNSPNPANTYGVVPCFSLAYVLDKIEEATELNIQGTLKTEFFRNIIFFNNHALNTFDGNGNPLLAPYINPANHLPDMTILELLVELGKLFCLGYYYSEDDNILHILHLPGMLTGNPIDITTLASPRYEKDVADPADGAVFSYEFPDSDKMYEQEDGAELSPYTIDGGKEPISSKIGTVFTRMKLVSSFSLFTGLFNFFKKVPVSIEAGTLGTEEGDPAPRILYYANRKTDGNGNLYPYATSDGLDQQENELVIDDFTGETGTNLLWATDKGLYDTWWKEWYDFEQNRQIVSLNTFWKMPELLNHTHEHQYSYFGQPFLVRRLQLNISSNRGLLAQSMDIDLIN